MNLTFFLQLAGLSHLALLCAGATMPAVVSMRTYLQSLPLFLRQLFWTYYCFIGLCLVGFGSVTFFQAGQIAAGQPLGRGVSLFLAIFWAVRLAIAGFVFKMGPYLTTPFFKWAYTALNVVFVYLIIIYTVAALHPIYH